MRGVDLNVFAFDYDLTWMAFVLDADGRVYARYGGRDGGPAEKLLSLAGLKHTLAKALVAYRHGEKPPAPPDAPPRTPEQFRASQRLRANACIHCHHVYNFEYEDAQADGKWTRDRVWVYPPPKNVGLTLDVDRGDHVQAVAPGSPAARAGLQPGDVLQRLNGQPVASIADVQYALHVAPKAGTVTAHWQRDGRELRGTLELPAGWRESDISWRPSMWQLSPAAAVQGKDLSPEEKRQLGLSEKRLAFRQGSYLPDAAKAGGLREGDIILGIGGRELEMTALQFNAYVRLNYNVGDRVTYDVLRDGRRLKVPVTLPAKAF